MLPQSLGLLSSYYLLARHTIIGLVVSDPLIANSLASAWRTPARYQCQGSERILAIQQDYSISHVRNDQIQAENPLD